MQDAIGGSIKELRALLRQTGRSRPGDARGSAAPSQQPFLPVNRICPNTGESLAGCEQSVGSATAPAPDAKQQKDAVWPLSENQFSPLR